MITWRNNANNKIIAWLSIYTGLDSSIVAIPLLEFSMEWFACNLYKIIQLLAWLWKEWKKHKQTLGV